MNNVSFTAVQSIFFLLFLLSVWLIVYKIVKAEEESVNYNGGEGWNKSICFQDYTTDEWNPYWSNDISGLLWLEIIVTFSRNIQILSEGIYSH